MAIWSDLAQWRGPTPNQGPGMIEQRGLVVHIAQGYYEGTIAWQKNPDANVSSHFIVAGAVDAPKGTPDGKLAQMVDTATAAWTQRSGNGHWLSIECAGFVPSPLSSAQIESIAQIYANGVKVYKWPLQLAGSPSGRGLGYHSMGCNQGWGHCDCPGPNIINQLPAILERAKQIINGPPAPTVEDDMYIVCEPNTSCWLIDGVDQESGLVQRWPLSLNAFNAYVDAQVAQRTATKALQPQFFKTMTTSLPRVECVGGGGTGASLDEIRQVVDEELDEQSMGGADSGT